MSDKSFMVEARPNSRTHFIDLLYLAFKGSARCIASVTPEDAGGCRLLYMRLVEHYISVRGLSSRIREDMRMFVELYECAVGLGVHRDYSTFHDTKFFVYYGQLQPEHTFLAEIGADIARRILVLGAHLVDLSRALETYKDKRLDEIVMETVRSIQERMRNGEVIVNV